MIAKTAQTSNIKHAIAIQSTNNMNMKVSSAIKAIKGDLFRRTKNKTKPPAPAVIMAKQSSKISLSR
jgi:hypothetical protein